MFFVLRRLDDKVFLQTRKVEDGEPVTTTTKLQEAKLFKLNLHPDHQVNQTEKVTNGEIVCEVEGDRIPAGLPGTWEIVPVDLRLA